MVQGSRHSGGGGGRIGHDGQIVLTLNDAPQRGAQRVVVIHQKHSDRHTDVDSPIAI